MSAYHSSFVSHAHADNDLCDRYVNALLAQARGIDIWYDRNNAQSGHFLGEQIQRELAARSAFVLLMTEASLKSFWVRLERESYLGLMASDPSRMLLAVRIGPCQPPRCSPWPSPRRGGWPTGRVGSCARPRPHPPATSPVGEVAPESESQPL